MRSAHWKVEKDTHRLRAFFAQLKSKPRHIDSTVVRDQLSSGAENLVQSGTYAVGRAGVYEIMNIYAVKMAGVFMISVSTISLRTRIVPRWMSLLGYALALLFLLSVGTIPWAPMVFPLWVFLIRLCILVERFRGQPDQQQQASMNR